MTPTFDAVEVGDELSPLTVSPVTRQTLAVYCSASGDHNPVHVDIDFAKAAGLDDVIAHGMLIMAYTGRLLTNWAPQAAIRSFNTRFQAMTRIGDEITATGRVVEKFNNGDDNYVRIELGTRDQHGESKTVGSAVLTL